MRLTEIRVLTIASAIFKNKCVPFINNSIETMFWSFLKRTSIQKYVVVCSEFSWKINFLDFVSIVYHITVHQQLEYDRIPTAPTECIDWFAKAKLNNNFIRCFKLIEMKYVYIFKWRWFISNFESFVTKNGFFQPN